MEKNAIANMKMVSLLSVCLGSVLILTSCSDGENKGLVACWKFEEGTGDRLLDTSGNGNHGTIHGAKWVTGRVGGGLRFDGVDDYVKVLKSASLNSINKEITLMCWIKTPLTGRHSIIERWPCGITARQRCVELDVNAEGKCVHFALSSTGLAAKWHKRPESISADKWVHIAATSDGQAMRVYVNGEPDPSASALENPRIHQSTADLHIGAWKTGSDKWESFFKGSMDEIKVYSRALTHEEILHDYKKSSPRGMVSGRVVDANGKPIRGAKVGAGSFHANTNRQGRCKIAVPPRTYAVVVSRKGYVTGMQSDIEVMEGQVTDMKMVLVADRVVPTVTEVKVKDVDGVNATITWATDEACTGTVKYGASSRRYDKTIKDTSYAKSHELTLAGLAAGTKYYFRIESIDRAQNAAISKERTFDTEKVDHPRLIVRKSDFSALRARAAKTPWKEMKVDAIARINRLTYKYDPSNQGLRYIRNRYSSMAGIASTGALAYILDPANKKSYKDKIVNALSDWDKLFVDARDWTGPKGQYWLDYDWSSAYTHSVLALDVIYDDLTPSERADLEAKLGRVADWFYVKRHPENYSHALYGIWALYRRDRKRIDSARSGWWEMVKADLTPGGVYWDGPGYAGASVARISDMGFHFFLSFAAEGDDLHKDPLFVAFFEWLYGAGYAPFGSPGRRRVLFSHSSFHVGVPGVSAYAARGFSEKAAGNASWVINGRVPPGRLMYYVLTDWPLVKPTKPLSHLWDGCASFWEDNPSYRSLMGALWNCSVSGRACQKQVNALHLSAYGEYVLRNTGWCKGADGQYDPPTVWGNTVLIDGAEHAFRAGAGIVEGFISPHFNYASGYSGPALPNGKHWRNFCFVHPQDGRCGYWAVFDEVDADKSSSKVNVALRPNSDKCTAVSDGLEYRWKIGPAGHTYSGHDVFFTIFLGTKPTAVNIKDAPFYGGGPKNPWVGKYIYSTYETDDKGRRNIVTVLFPYDATHPKAKMTRISGKDYSGAKVNLGDSITDTAIESSGKKVVTHGSVSFRGLAALYRLKGKSNTFYFVRKCRSFNDGAKPRRGFESDADISVYVKDKQGRIISPGAKVTFYYPGITGVLLDSKATPVLDSGAGWVKVTVASGNHDLKFKAKPGARP